MPKLIIGKRERVQDLKKVWPRETDFSDWLAEKDGVAFLAEELGLEVENLTRESRPGDFPCDIRGNLVGDEGHVVVIENQYGKTDHDHLGKLLTYAAVHKATTGIWISESISDDHRQVIDWLNEITPPTVNLYLVSVKLYRIGNSAAAPQLDIVSRPNLAVKEGNRGGTPAERELWSWRRRMWTEILEAIREAKPTFRLQRPGSDHWSSINFGRSGFYLNMLLTPKRESIGIDVYINSVWKDEAFNALLEQKTVIEEELGSSLIWMPLPAKKTARILLEAKIDPRKPENEAQVRDWFTENSIKMFSVFRPRILALAAPPVLSDTHEPGEPADAELDEIDERG
jgi:hypothetical protein